MLEKAFSGSKRYWSWVFFLLVLIGIGFGTYLYQLNQGLTVTGMGRDVSWGLYIGQLVFFVGVAASAVIVVLPYYLHNVKEFGRITVFGEFLAIPAVIMCILFVVVDLGSPARVFNLFAYPSLNSVMFWDTVVLGVYLLLNLIIGWNVLEAERNAVSPPKWVKMLIYLSIPWAVSIHTVTAFLFSGLPGKHYWLTAIIAARFLASAFAAGPALLIILSLVIKKLTKFDPGKVALNKLAIIVTYATVVSVFFVILELFTAFYSKVPGHMYSLKYLFVGLDGYVKMIPLMWLFVALIVIALVLLINPVTRKSENILLLACGAVFVSMMIEKGMAFLIGGFVPNTFKKVTEYVPTLPELLITIGVWSIGALILTILYKIVISVKEEVRA